MSTDLTAPGLLGYLLAPAWTAAIVGFSSFALFNSLPGMMLAVSRLMFAWAEDGIFFRSVSRVHPRWRTPHVAILVSSFMATAGIFGCHFAGDFFLGVDVLVIGMLVNFTLVCLSVVFLARRNPALAVRVPRAHARTVPGDSRRSGGGSPRRASGRADRERT